MSIAERLDWLFTNVRRPDGSEYSFAEVEQAIREAGASVSTSTLHKIRHGVIRNPGYLTLKAIANFFKVPITFFDTDEVQDTQLTLPSNDIQIQQIALRAVDLTSESKEALLTLIKQLKQNK